MSPKVNKKQKLVGGRLTSINGPTGRWKADEKAAVVTFVIKQGNNGTTAVGIGETHKLNRPVNGRSFRWSATVDQVSGPAFVAGPADVQAWASIAESDGPYLYGWNVPITIS
ncbi:MAG TPA: hypothetical protein VFW14_18925 [Gaiellales bacterium]|jgi:hypothetical protein|nr:hypothetical protein [Gaiellales bacterium]